MTTVSDHPLAYQTVELLVPCEGWGLDAPPIVHPAGTRGLVFEVFADGGLYIDLEIPEGHPNEYHYDFVSSRVEDVVLVRTYRITDAAQTELRRIRDTGEFAPISGMTDEEIKARLFSK